MFLFLIYDNIKTYEEEGVCKIQNVLTYLFLSICLTLYYNEALLCCFQHIGRDYYNCYIKTPTNSLKNAFPRFL